MNPIYDDIRPYNDAEVVAAAERLAQSPLLAKAAAALFPDKEQGWLQDILRKVSSVNEFQVNVTSKVMERVIANFTDGLTCSGLDNFIESDGSIGKFLLLSTHRDIVLDPALIQMALYRAGYPCTEIAVGDNLLANSDIEDAMRSNRMIKVVRSDNPRVVYTTSKLLSAYMRERITQGESSVWIAHRQGRTKDGNDATEQGLLKMLNMSANSGFTESFAELRIMPVAVSYEYETCGALKVLELYMKEQQGFYRKAPGEDTNSMLQGFIQPKGRVHIAFGKPLTFEEIKSADAAEHNDKFRNLAQIIDGHLMDLFKLWPTNYAAADILGGSDTHFKDGKYSEADKVAFTEHIKKETEGMPEAIYRRLLELYAAHINNQNK